MTDVRTGRRPIPQPARPATPCLLLPPHGQTKGRVASRITRPSLAARRPSGLLAEEPLHDIDQLAHRRDHDCLLSFVVEATEYPTRLPKHDINPRLKPPSPTQTGAAT